MGKPIGMDNYTTKEARLHYARILVEIDPNFTYPTTVQGLNYDGDVIDIQVSSEYMPCPCENCNVFGHSSKNCGLSFIEA